MHSMNSMTTTSRPLHQQHAALVVVVEVGPLTPMARTVGAQGLPAISCRGQCNYLDKAVWTPLDVHPFVCFALWVERRGGKQCGSRDHRGRSY
jgi:hypothetical protein